MFDAQKFAVRLAERKDRWSLLTDFAAEWHSPLQEGDGYSAAELDAAEQRLGLKLPLALREWYRLMGRRKDIVAMQSSHAKLSSCAGGAGNHGREWSARILLRKSAGGRMGHS